MTSADCGAASSRSTSPSPGSSTTSSGASPEYEVLWELTNASDNRLRMNELARHLLFTRSGVTRLIDRLEAAGYVERDVCDHDGRGVYAALTESGFAAFEAAAIPYIDRLRELFFDRLKGDLRETRRLLGRLTPDA
jgi:DNA-binding MarR family transcriptional regulator